MDYTYKYSPTTTDTSCTIWIHIGTININNLGYRSQKVPGDDLNLRSKHVTRKSMLILK